MTLAAGTRLDAYEIVGPLGAGGMGEVYRAHDARLGRDVAIKVLPDAVAGDAERHARFAREAQLLAALNHPNIAQVYGIVDLPEEDDLPAKAGSYRVGLVMELVEGEGLDALIARGLSIDEAVAIARGIADAIEAAHERGIIHRDLKPANVKVTDGGRVKVLDFGLAKATDPSGTMTDLANSPTVLTAATQLGTILGTAAYMSPEQARGKSVDKRTDIWAFGCVLYEMLTGQRAFEGETVTDILSAIIQKQPDMTRLPAATPPAVATLLARCLEKDQARRLRDIGEARLALENTAASSVTTAPTTTAPMSRLVVRRSAWRRVWPIGAAALLGGLAVGAAMWFTRPAPGAVTVTRFTIIPPEGTQLFDTGLQTLALSPSGDRVAYVADRQIYVRSMSQLGASPLLSTPATQVIYDLAFSPDGESIAYWTSGAIMIVAASGGPSAALVRGTPVYGLSWTPTGILYAVQDKVLRVPSTGGDPEIVATAPSESRAWHPQLLPDRKTIIYTALQRQGTNRTGTGTLMAQRIGDAQPIKLLDDIGDARFVPPGHLVFARQGTVFAVPFDAAHLALSGGPVPVLDGVRRVGANAQFTIAPGGVLAYMRGAVDRLSVLQQRSLIMVGRDGTRVYLKPPSDDYSEPRVSPDGRSLAFVTDDDSGGSSIWIYDLNGTTAARRLTFGGIDRAPVWSADSTHVAFASNRAGDVAIFWQRADGSGAAERLTKPEAGGRHFPRSWSADGTVLLYDEVKERNFHLMMWRARDRSSAPFGHWVAYSVNPTGDTGAINTVFIQPFPATGALFQISKRNEQAYHPVWANKGAELRYSPGFVSVPLTLTPAFAAGESKGHAANFSGVPSSMPRPYDVAPDGTLYALTSEPRDVRAAAAVRTNEIQIVLNWTDELKKKVPSPWR
jgi:WD40 repeat protein